MKEENKTLTIIVDTYPEQEEYFEQLGRALQAALAAERMISFGEWLKSRVGSNWVIFARRTKNIVERYGEDVVIITPKRYQMLEKEYEALTGRKAY